MTTTNKNKETTKKGNSKSQTTKKSFYTKRKKEITFDPDARKEFLCGFSDRKRQRRAFGLAMQKVKDRQVKLEERKETRSAVLERVEEAERAKEVMVQERLKKVPSSHWKEAAVSEDVAADGVATTMTTYEDSQTQQQWGGQVIVTTTMAPLMSDDESDDNAPAQNVHVDHDQREAGNVHHFLDKLKTKMPAKGKSAHATKFKGKHGAANMKGMGGAANLKMAQKVLSKFATKEVTKNSKGKGKKKGRN